MTVLHWHPGQVALRVLVGLLPLVALLAPAPRLPHLGVLVLTVGLSLLWALLPESPAGVLVILLVASWWAIAVEDPLGPRLVAVAVGLVAAHVAAVLASYGPLAMPLPRDLLLLWARRLGVLAACPVALLAAVLAVRGTSVPGSAWPVALVATAALLVSASLALRTPAPGDGGG